VLALGRVSEDLLQGLGGLGVKQVKEICNRPLLRFLPEHERLVFPQFELRKELDKAIIPRVADCSLPEAALDGR